jgi:hypothetical protein
MTTATNIVQAALDEIEKNTATVMTPKGDILPHVIRAQWEDRRTAAIDRLATALERAATGITFHVNHRNVT